MKRRGKTCKIRIWKRKKMAGKRAVREGSGKIAVWKIEKWKTGGVERREKRGGKDGIGGEIR